MNRRMISAVSLAVVLALAGCSGTAPTTSGLPGAPVGGNPVLNCKPSYLTGSTPNDIANGLATVYDCAADPKVVPTEAAVGDYVKYLVGGAEYAKQQNTYSDLVARWDGYQFARRQFGSGGTYRYRITCVDLESSTTGLVLTVKIDQITSGFSDSRVNATATEYDDYTIVPTTPQQAELSATDNSTHIWVAWYSQARGTDAPQYLNAGSCDASAPWSSGYGPPVNNG